MATLIVFMLTINTSISYCIRMLFLHLKKDLGTNSFLTDDEETSKMRNVSIIKGINCKSNKAICNEKSFNSLNITYYKDI